MLIVCRILLSVIVVVFSLLPCFSQEKHWFPFAPKGNYQQSVINTSNWLDAPAGKYGPVMMNSDRLQFANGRPIKFWGVNICSERPFVTAGEADRWSEFISVFGINAVRFHKFTWDASDGIHSTQLTDTHWKNFDYFCQALRNRGIYYSWSHIYGHRVLKADSARLLAYNEVANTKFPWAHLNGTTSSLVNFAEDLQDLNIELTVNMLLHLNPNTGLRYADDPALVFVELQNEDNIFWSAIEETLKQTPTYRSLLCKKFSNWLREKYTSQEALEKAWGAGVLPQGETLQKANIYPHPNHGMISYESERAWKAKKPLPQHVTDKAIFLFEEQSKFYKKFVEAIRRTGYKGLIVGSCWQAGSGIAHMLNLRADYDAGVIDRHNYFGGGTGHSFQPGPVRNEAMVNQPGSGLLSTGFQQVQDRPFFISEWMSLIPNQWTAESAPIIATYGMGLQGWDASFSFAMDLMEYSETIQSGHGVYNVTSPTQLGLYPALSRMVYRNDITEGPILARTISMKDIYRGRLPFWDKVEQEYDVKEVESQFPMESLAMKRIVNVFADSNDGKALALPVPDNQRSKRIASATGQLNWYRSSPGYFTIDSKGTQGIIGFAKNKRIDLTDISIQTRDSFSVILITSLDQNKTISQASRLLITAIARAKNTGMEYDAKITRLVKTGRAPILLEPVNFKLNFKNYRKARIEVLDHDGNRTSKEVASNKDGWQINGSQYQTLYYEVVFE